MFTTLVLLVTAFTTLLFGKTLSLEEIQAGGNIKVPYCINVCNKQKSKIPACLLVAKMNCSLERLGQVGWAVVGL